MPNGQGFSSALSQPKRVKSFFFLLPLLFFSLFELPSGYAQSIAGGGLHTLTVCTDGTVRACGYNAYGQLGIGTADSTIHSTPVQITSLFGVTAVAAGNEHSLFLKNDGTVWACGRNDLGQLGDGTATHRTAPVQVAITGTVTAIAAGGEYSLFLKNDSTVWACGWNASGQLGDGTTTSRITPVQVTSLSGISVVAAGEEHSLFLKNDSTVWACGSNANGQLGTGTADNNPHSTPVQVTSLSGITAVSGGNGVMGSHSLFLKNDGTVWACGANWYGQLGDGNITDKYTPVQVPFLNGITIIVAGYENSFFLKNDGTVWACGDNWYGQLGDGTTTDGMIPVQVAITGIITSVAVGDGHSLFLKNDGKVWTGGWNGFGQLGDGTSTDRLTPVQMNTCLSGNPKVVIGSVFNDINQNCSKDAYEPGLPNRSLFIIPGNIVVQTDAFGYWYIDSLPAGVYTITADTSGKWQKTCPVSQNFTVTNPDSLTLSPGFGFVSTEPCPAPEVSVTMPFMRPGFSNQNIYVQTCNKYIGTGALDSAYVILTLDSLIIPQSATLSYNSLGNNAYLFNLGNINPGQCVNFSVTCSLSVNATIGSTLCMKANIYPADSCVFDTIRDNPPAGVSPCNLSWDRSSLEVDGWCQNDSIYFTITNTGDTNIGDMQCFSAIRVFVDGQLTILDSVMLAGGASITFVFAGDGRTWRLEADQHPLHPGNSHPNATIELCGNSANWTPDLVNILPQDDADPMVDIFCDIVTASYDPNDKRGFPLGVESAHYIYPNQSLEYVIRFQNTGTDTAFTIVIRDTLDNNLDIFSVQPGTASHNYTFRMYGTRILEWTFSNILLPDSNINEPQSHGFATFKVNQNKNLSNGTIIENMAGIYFDFNVPVLTNTYLHIVDDRIKILTGTKEMSIILQQESSMNVYPNPTRGSFTVEVGNWKSEGGRMKLEIYDMKGALVYQSEISSSKTSAEHSQSIEIPSKNWAKGNYFVNLISEGKTIVSEKIVLE